MIDCDLLAKVYINLIDQKEPTLNFQDHHQVTSENQTTEINYYKKVVRITEDEILKHKEYLKSNLKKNYFN